MGYLVSDELGLLRSCLIWEKSPGVFKRKRAVTAEEFALFWERYPLRVGKLAAMKAYKKSRDLASAQEILDGVDRYVLTKPHWQAWAHPSSWLNQGRWMDEGTVSPNATKKIIYPCPHESPCVTTWACGRKQQAE